MKESAIKWEIAGTGPQKEEKDENARGGMHKKAILSHCGTRMAL